MESFCFNRRKEPGVREILFGDKVLEEAVVRKGLKHGENFQCNCRLRTGSALYG